MPPVAGRSARFRTATRWPTRCAAALSSYAGNPHHDEAEIGRRQRRLPSLRYRELIRQDRITLGVADGAAVASKDRGWPLPGLCSILLHTVRGTDSIQNTPNPGAFGRETAERKPRCARMVRRPRPLSDAQPSYAANAPDGKTARRDEIDMCFVFHRLYTTPPALLTRASPAQW